MRKVLPLSSALIATLLALPALSQDATSHVPSDERAAEANVFMNAKVVSVNKDQIEIRDNDGKKRTLVLAEDAVVHGTVKAGSNVLIAFRDKGGLGRIVSMRASEPSTTITTAARRPAVTTILPPAEGLASPGLTDQAAEQAAFLSGGSGGMTTGSSVPPAMFFPGTGLVATTSNASSASPGNGSATPLTGTTSPNGSLNTNPNGVTNTNPNGSPNTTSPNTMGPNTTSPNTTTTTTAARVPSAITATTPGTVGTDTLGVRSSTGNISTLTPNSSTNPGFTPRTTTTSPTTGSIGAFGAAALTTGGGGFVLGGGGGPVSTVGTSPTIATSQSSGLSSSAGSLGADASPLPIGNAVRAYEAAVARLAAHIGAVDQAFAQYRGACVGPQSGPGHSWNGIWDGSSARTETSDECASLLGHAVRQGEDIQRQLSGAEDMARRSGVLPGIMRQIRSSYGMDWSGWDR